MALRNGASRQTNSPVLPPSAGASEPNKSTKSVCSDKLIRVKSFPVALASADIKLVLPTPGLPSKRIGLFTCIALTTRIVLAAVVGALKLKSSSLECDESLGIVNPPASKVSFDNLISTASV